MSINKWRLPCITAASFFICKMVIPRFLRPGDEIRLISPSRWADESLVVQAEASLKARGYVPTRGKHVLARDGQLGGTDVQRMDDFLSAWNDSGVKAIWALRGGYGAQRILDGLGLQLDTSISKWFIGFSDSTAIHGLLNTKGLAGLHAPMWSTMSNTEPKHIESIFDILSGDLMNVAFDSHSLDVPGRSIGRLVGGNLSVLQTMVGTSSFPIKEGDILFIEDLDEMLYHVDRMLLHLSRSGSLVGLSGILIGGMSDMRDNTLKYGFSSDNPFGKTTEEVLSEHLSGLGIPVGFSFPAGHTRENHPIILGSYAEMVISGSGNQLNLLVSG